MESAFKNLYDKLPIIFQNVILSAYSGLLDKERYGGKFSYFQNLLNISQFHTSAQLKEYQDSKLKELISYSYEHVPYYRRVMDERGLTPYDIQTSNDLIKLPILTKDIINKNFSDLLSDEYNLKTVKKGHTSGTTGSPLEICYSSDLIHINYALLDRQYKWAGINLKRFGDRIAIIRGNVIVPLKQNKPPFWRHNYFHNHMLLSSFHMSQDNLKHYVDGLIKFNPKVLDGYPSTVYVLAKYLKNKGQHLKLDAVLTSSETLFDFQREIIEETFQCKIFDYFGAAERVMFSTECEKHEGHHIASEYGITEILDRNHKPIDNNEIGYLVATSLHNYAMPMIRYMTNDMTAIKSDNCSCGRALPLMEDVTTKAEDLLTLKDGRLISPSVLTHPLKPLTSIIESQIIQENLDDVVIKLVVSDDFTDSHESELIHGLGERLGEGVNIRIEKVDELQRTSSGKFKWVISKVALGI